MEKFVPEDLYDMALSEPPFLFSTSRSNSPALHEKGLRDDITVHFNKTFLLHSNSLRKYNEHQFKQFLWELVGNAIETAFICYLACQLLLVLSNLCFSKTFCYHSKRKKEKKRGREKDTFCHT